MYSDSNIIDRSSSVADRKSLVQRIELYSLRDRQKLDGSIAKVHSKWRNK